MQNSYILLRDNKESGALNIEDLQQIGLKETDLIWVECQSMDWRSPGEIPELKKLLTAGNYNSTANKTEMPEIPVNKVQPGKNTNDTQKRDAYIKDFEKYSHPEFAALPGFEKKEKHSQPVTALTAGAQAGYTEQNAPAHKSAFTSHLAGRLKKPALYAGLVLAGALLMFVVMNWGGKKGAVVQQKMPPPENGLPSSTAATSSIQNTSPVVPPANVSNSELLSKNAPDSAKQVRKTKVTLPKTLPPITTASTDSQNAIINDAGKNIKPVAEIKPKPVSMEEISSKIALTANDYKVGFMGGVRDLAITLQNNSGYLLNKVTVKIDYVNSAGNVVNTDQLDFKSVKAGDAKVMQVDRSKRGIKVKYYITAIECKASGSSRQTAETDPGNGLAN